MIDNPLVKLLVFPEIKLSYISQDMTCNVIATLQIDICQIEVGVKSSNEYHSVTQHFMHQWLGRKIT